MLRCCWMTLIVDIIMLFGKRGVTVIASSSSLVQILWTSFLLLLNSSPSVIALDLPLSVVDSRLNCRGKGSVMMIHWWISENRGEFHCIVLEFNSGKLGFEKLFLSFSEFFVNLIVTKWREKLVNCLWCGVNFVAPLSDLYSSWPFIGCHVCLWTNGDAPPGLGLTCKKRN